MLAFKYVFLLMSNVFLTVVTTGLSVGGELSPSSVDPEFQRSWLWIGNRHCGFAYFIPIPLPRNYGCTCDIRFCLIFNNSLESRCSGKGRSRAEAVVSRDRGVEGSHQHRLLCSGRWCPVTQGDVGPPQVKREDKGNRSWAVGILQ